MTKEMVLKNLEALVGTEFDADEVICAFEDFEENGETEVIVTDTNYNGFKKVAYVNTRDAVEFYFNLQDNIITSVEMF